MKLRSRSLPVAALSSLLWLVGCSKGYFSSPPYLEVTISPRPATLAAGASVQLSATVTNGLSLPTWSLLDANQTSAGTLATVPASPDAITYTAPAAPPIYTGRLPAGFTQGTVNIDVAVPPPPKSTLPVAHDSVSVVILGPVSVGLTPATATVPLGTTLALTGYAVGATNNLLTWEVNAVPGGSTSTGTITAAGVYSAPSVLPMTGDTVTVTAVAQADPTKSASSTLTLQ